MKTRVFVVLASMLMALAATVSCSRAPSDSAIIADVQARIHQDTALTSASINVQSSKGVVVLSGNVATDTARIAAENAARQAEGVKGVINNLEVVAAAAAVPSPPSSLSAEATVPNTRPRPPEMPRKPKSAPAAAPAPATAPQTSPATAAPPLPVPVETAGPQPAQPIPVQITIPTGTRLSVRLVDPINTATNKEGDTFRASVDSPIVIDNKIVIPKYAETTAQLVSAKSAGRFAGSSSVALVLTRVVVGGTAYDLQTGEYAQKGASRGSRTAKVVGGTAAVGAVIGALAGGGKGAAVGAAAGAGAGTAAQALTKGEQIKLPAETILEFQLQAPLTVTSVG